jgi:hypothetical protein
MGLTLTGYANVTDCGEQSRGNWDEETQSLNLTQQVYIYKEAEPFFSQWLGSLKEGHVYKFSGELASYDSGYGTFNNLRKFICKFAMNRTLKEFWDEPEPFKGLPFFEILYFGDNEGFIGPEGCRKLAHDFEKYRLEFEIFLAKSFQDGLNHRYFFKLYNDLLKVFKTGADNGFVQYH